MNQITYPTPSRLYKMYHVSRMSIRDIAKKLGVTYAATRNHMIKVGIKLRPVGCADVMVRVNAAITKTTVRLSKTDICRYQSGISANRIAQDLGIQTATVIAALKRSGVDVRTRSESLQKDKNPAWKGGTTRRVLTSNIEVGLRNACFERDRFTCKLCHSRGGNLHSHHIRLYIEYPEYRYDLDNRITLCYNCHRKILHPLIILLRKNKFNLNRTRGGYNIILQHIKNFGHRFDYAYRRRIYDLIIASY